MAVQYAIVEADQVVNVVLVDDGVDPQALWPQSVVVPIQSPAGIGWRWNEVSQEFEEPVPPAADPTPEA